MPSRPCAICRAAPASGQTPGRWHETGDDAQHTADALDACAACIALEDAIHQAWIAVEDAGPGEGSAAVARLDELLAKLPPGAPPRTVEGQPDVSP